MALRRAAVTETPAKETVAETVAETVVKTTVAAEVESQAANVQSSSEENNQGPEDEAQVEEVADNVAEAANVAAEAHSNQAEAAAKPKATPNITPELKPEPTAVAARNESTAVAQTNSERAKGAAAQFTEDMAQQGFEGLELNGMSFDRLKLDEGQFVLGSEEIKMGESIQVNIMTTRSIYVVRQHSGQKAEMFYSYDPQGLLKSDGSSAAEILAEWAADGYPSEDEPLQIKQYLEGMAQLVNRDDEYEGHMVSLSIPPASRPRLAGAVAVGQRKFACGPADLIIKCTVGAKIGKGDEAFRPWVFAAEGIMQ